jgi:hypothetical protein
VAGALNYSFLDRLLHRLAFCSPSVQLFAADLEESMFGKGYAGREISRPLFVTSLPRAGTTLLLEAISELPGVVTHSYRDMPFILAPILWDRLSSGFKVESKLEERAHGDGMLVGFDSPEAFEEVLWKVFWPEKYTPTSIGLWSARDRKTGFETHYRDHLRKLLFLRAGSASKEGRYLSKNNANIARIPYLRRLFPDAAFVIPFRHPVEHATSMLRQHRNFIKQHSEDSFTRKYMADIGHYEFGELHRPIAFPGAPDGEQPADERNSLDYWLRYWIAAYRHVLSEHADDVLVSYEHVCSDNGGPFQALAERLGFGVDESVVRAAAKFHAPSMRAGTSEPSEARLIAEAESLHQELILAANQTD